MSVPCDPQSLATAATPYQVPLAGLELDAIIYLLCQIANQSGGGGGGSGTVTSFSAGNLAPLFTTTVTNPNTTPNLAFNLTNQNANLFFAGPTAGGAAAPTFRAMVSADLGTTLTPQFAQLGVGTAPVGTVALAVDATSLAPAITVNAFQVTHPGAGASDVSVFQCNSTLGDPYFTMGVVAVDGGAIIQYKKAPTNHLVFGIHGHGATQVAIDSSGGVTAAGAITSTGSNIISSNGNIRAEVGIFVCQGNNGISQTFDIGLGNTQITFVGGIATAIA